MAWIVSLSAAVLLTLAAVWLRARRDDRPPETRPQSPSPSAEGGRTRIEQADGPRTVNDSSPAEPLDALPQTPAPAEESRFHSLAQQRTPLPVELATPGMAFLEKLGEPTADREIAVAGLDSLPESVSFEAASVEGALLEGVYACESIVAPELHDDLPPPEPLAPPDVQLQTKSEETSAFIGVGRDHDDYAVQLATPVLTASPSTASSIGQTLDEPTATLEPLQETVEAGNAPIGDAPSEAPELLPPPEPGVNTILQSEFSELDEKHARLGGYEMNDGSVPEQADPAEPSDQRNVSTADIPSEMGADPAPAPRFRPAVRGVAQKNRQPRSRAPREVEAPKLLPIVVRLVRQRGGFCRVTLVPARSAALADVQPTCGVGCPAAFSVLQDNWHGDVEPPQLQDLLRDGIAWESRNGHKTIARWVLGRRDVFVLSVHGELHGYVSCPRLTIGQDHIVFCTAERLSEVEAALSAAGASAGSRLEWEADDSKTWVVIDGVQPSKPVPQGADGDLLNVLRPLADAQISLRAGIRLTRSAYLKDFPPQIRILGDAANAGDLLIDGVRAQAAEDGVFTVPGWDEVGDHVVSCSTGTKSYQIEEGVEGWEPWDAYTWSDGETCVDATSRPSLCGLIVRPPRCVTGDGKHITVPLTNPFLLGSQPGEVYFCYGRPDLHARTCSGYPWFEPVWALPPDPIHCDKRTATVLQLRRAPVQLQSVLPASRELQRRVDLWTRLLTDARLKGLMPSDVDSARVELWKSYCTAARLLRRRAR